MNDVDQLVVALVRDINKVSGYPMAKSKARARIQEILTAERDAWIAGTRCFFCGNEMEHSPTSNTCANCWETL